MKDNNILHLTLKRKWFDMIASGEKREEYREIKSYWEKRLKKEYTEVVFKNGYSKGCPEMRIELNSIRIGFGQEDWGAPDDEVFILSLGKIKSIKY